MKLKPLTSLIKKLKELLKQSLKSDEWKQINFAVRLSAKLICSPFGHAHVNASTHNENFQMPILTVALWVMRPCFHNLS